LFAGTPDGVNGHTEQAGCFFKAEVFFCHDPEVSNGRAWQATMTGGQYANGESAIKGLARKSSPDAISCAFFLLRQIL
ncbi:MAG: hypothetical protein ACKPJJ_03645, partial [Planctomycetaceae bacterium]